MASILVVEDEVLVAKDIQHALQRLGYVVPSIASNGDDALRKVEEEKPDLVLMDIMLKGASDGVQTAHVMRERFRIPVVYLTAYADDDSLTRARVTEPFGYIVKPFNQKELRSAIEMALYKHQMEEKLREREHWFSTTLRSIGEGVIAVDSQRRVTFMNTVAETLTQWSAADAAACTVQQVFGLIQQTTRQARVNPCDAALDHRSTVGPDEDVVLVGKQGREVPVGASAAPIVDDRGTMLGAVLVFRDLTERKKLQEKLASADRLASVGTMAAGIAHEINNPMTFVVGNVGVASEEVSQLVQDLKAGMSDGCIRMGAAELLRRLEEIDVAMREASRGGDRVRQIVDDLRVFSRAEGKIRKHVDLREVLEFAIKMTSNQIKHRAVLTRDYGTLNPVEANEAHLGQVFVNLLVNAAQAIPEGKAHAHEIRVVTRMEGQHAVVEVHDTGEGMPENVRRRIFDPFFTTKPVGVGTGLGLSISHRIVVGLGGEITVASQPGTGSCFCVRLPTVLPVHVAEARPQPPVKASTGRARVLVVDDEEMVGTTVKRMLMNEHDVESLTGAQHALRRISEGERYDVILCDLMMPAMSGMDLHDALITLAPDQAQRMLFLSGGAFTERAQAVLDRFPNRALKKPFEPNGLRGLVRDFLHTRGPVRPAQNVTAPTRGQ
jgi:PAS domain S-box-containing protein